MADTIRIFGSQPGDDYTTQSAMIADIPTGPTGIIDTGGNWRIQHRDGETYPKVELKDLPRGTDVNHQIIFEAVPGDEADGTGLKGPLYLGDSSNVGEAFDAGVNEEYTNYVIIQGLRIDTQSTNSAVGSVFVGKAIGITVQHCFITSSTSGIEAQNGSNGIFSFYNCIIAFCGSNGIDFGRPRLPGAYTVNRCTFLDNTGYGVGDRGFGDIGPIYVKNTLSLINQGNDFQPKLSNEGADVDYLASSDTTANEAHSVSFINRTTADLEDYAGGNYNLASTSSLKGAGENGEDIGATLPASGGSPPDPEQTIEVPLVTNTVTMYQPSLTKDQLISLDTIGSTVTIEQPTVTQDKRILLPSIDSTETVSNPTVTQDKEITLDTIGSTESVEQPSVSTDTFQELFPSPLVNISSVYSPTFVQDKLIQLGNLVNISVTFDPTFVQDKLIQLLAIGSTESVPEPSLVQDKLLLLDTLENVSQVHIQTISGGFRPIPEITLYNAEGYGAHIRSVTQMNEVMKEIALRLQAVEKNISS